MKPTKNVVISSAVWTQPRVSQREFELRREGELVGRLEFPKALGSLAVAEYAGRRWTFKRVGFFSTRVTVRREGEESDLAVYEPRWSGLQGTLRFSDGRVYGWTSTSFWGQEFAFVDQTNAAVVVLHSGGPEFHLSDIFKTQATVEVCATEEDHPMIPLLVLLGWYLLILHHQDAAASGGAVVAATG